MNKFDAKPKEAIFIGDSCDELEGAKKLGFVTIGLKCGCGDYNLSKLDEISKILRKIKSAK